MQPKRILIVEPVTLQDGKVLAEWTYTWQLGDTGGGRILIEHRGREYAIPASSAVASPVPAPTPEKLLALDPCFADPAENLQEVYRNDKHMFTVSRCPHGNYFLKDTRGGVIIYTVMIFMGCIDDTSETSLLNLWAKYHDLPSDTIHHLGIGR